jgi:chemotaxis response regulator CheB
MITVLIAEDHSLLRNVLQCLIEGAGDIQIVAIVIDGQEAVEKAT